MLLFYKRILHLISYVSYFPSQNQVNYKEMKPYGSHDRMTSTFYDSKQGEWMDGWVDGWIAWMDGSHGRRIASIVEECCVRTKEWEKRAL
jgi:hypothetical protein